VRRADRSRASPRPDPLLLAGLAIAAALATAAALSLRSGAPTSGDPPARAAEPQGCGGCNLLFVVLDAARADHFGAYGYARPTTPSFDALAAESVVFERAFSNASFTRASIASLFSGQPPGWHGVLQVDHLLPGEVTTLAETLDAHGYRTAAFSENPLVDRAYGYGQGFEVFRRLHGGEPGRMGEVARRVDELDLASSREHVGEMLAWASGPESEGPFFLYAHFLRPHNPYHALPEHAGRFAGAYAGPFTGSTEELVAINAGRVQVGAEDLAHLIDLYDENLLSADSLLGALVDGLRAQGLLDSTIAVVFSDHGEAFLEHGKLLHGLQVFREELWVPLLVRFPSAMAIPPHRRQEEVQLSDLMPTLIDALGIHESARPPERSLMPLFSGHDTPAAGATLVSHGVRATSLQEGELKYIRRERGKGAKDLLFDLADDPGEIRDLARERADDAARMRAELAEVLESQRVGAPPTTTQATGDELREQLRVLGYLDEGTEDSAAD
jgi:arylsulfatase A-like enzyme